MKKALLFTLGLIVSGSVFSQSFSGEATYQSATSFDFPMDSTRMSVEQYEMIKQRMAKALQKEFTLSFNKTASLFKEVEKLEEEGRGGMRMGISMLSGTGGLVYKNVKENELREQTEFFGKQFLIKDELENYGWKLGKETKMIGSYTCYKATATREVVNRSFKKDGSTTDTSTVDVVAWYTPQIPLSQGPDIYWGLPGLIMEVNFKETTILCTKIVLNKDKEIEIDAPDKGEEVTREEYTSTILKKMEELEATYGGRQGQGRGGRGRPNMSIQISR
ncbi:MAG: GLPGLI family protein [Schleiferiaceae bacterium]|jgi:GLPGLI family protein|nr:GLPGLI family protein [Schleiferiaceae bacterium]